MSEQELAKIDRFARCNYFGSAPVASADVLLLLAEVRRLRAGRARTAGRLRALRQRLEARTYMLTAERNAEALVAARLLAERDEALHRMHVFNADADEMEAERNAALAQRDELRAVLAPVLADPLKADACQFCGADIRESYVVSMPDSMGGGMRRVEQVGEHAPACPVLRRDALLGREPDT